MNLTERQPLYKLTHGAFRFLSANFTKHLEYYKDPTTDFGKLLNKHGINNYREKTNVYIIRTIKLDSSAGRSHLADSQALDFYNSFEGMTPRLASDPYLLAYLNHFYLHSYGVDRWPIYKNTKLDNIRKHWLTESTENKHIYKSSISGRTWWIAYMAIKSAESSAGEFDAKQALEKFRKTPEYYHRSMEYVILRNRILMAEFIRALHIEAEGITRKGYLNMLKEINREAGARLIDSMDRQHLRKLVQRAADRQMYNLKSARSQTSSRSEKR